MIIAIEFIRVETKQRGHCRIFVSLTGIGELADAARLQKATLQICRYLAGILRHLPVAE